MANFMQSLEHFLWEEVFGRADTKPKLFTMKMARSFLMEAAEKDDRVAGCILSVQPKGEKYEVVQLMVDKEEELIKLSREAYMGRRMLAEDVDEGVFTFLDGASRKTLRLPT